MLLFIFLFLCIVFSRKSRSRRLAFILFPTVDLHRAKRCITVLPNNIPNKQQIRQTGIFHIFFLPPPVWVFFFFSFCFFLHSQMSFMSQRFSLLNISLVNNTNIPQSPTLAHSSSPPGTSTRRAEPGAELTPGFQPGPRGWHSDSRSDLPTDPWSRPGHFLLVQDTVRTKGHRQRKRKRGVKVRCLEATFLFV